MDAKTPSSTSPSTILCYRRKSLVITDQDLISPEIQATTVNAMCIVQGLETEWYEDIDGHRSGRKEAGRPGWLTLKTQLDRPEVAGIAAYSLDRIGRNTLDCLKLINYLEQQKKRLILVKENIDTGSAMGRAITTILMAMYQVESDLASERQITGIKYRRYQLGRHWGTVPFGYIRNSETGKLEPDANGVFVPGPDETILERRYADAVKRLYEMALNSEDSNERLAIRMNAEKWMFHDRRGTPREWTKDDVRRVLDGWRIYGGNITVGCSKEAKSKIEVIPDTHQAIVDSTTIEEIAKRQDSIHSRHAHITTGMYLLSGIGTCAHCGARIYGMLQYEKRRYRHNKGYGCAETYMEADQLEIHIKSIIGNIDIEKTSEVLQKAILNITVSPQMTLQEDVENLKAAREKLARIARIYADGLISEAEYMKAKEEVDAKVLQLHAEPPERKISALDTAFRRLRQLLVKFQDDDPKVKRGVILDLFARVEVSGGCITRCIPNEWLKELWDIRFPPGS